MISGLIFLAIHVAVVARTFSRFTPAHADSSPQFAICILFSSSNTISSPSRYAPRTRFFVLKKNLSDFTILDISSDVSSSALKTLESSGAIRIERRGRNGSYLVEMDNKALLTHVDINNVVCAMPLPYTRLYEGLASGLKAQFDGIPFYYAHMRGADIRVECLLNGVYDMAVVSRLAAESYLTQKGLCLALELGPHTYVGEHQLICRKGESANVKRVGLDNRSADQKIMTDVFFGDSDVERVDLSYHESLQRIVKGDVDAVIWNVVAENELTMLGLEATPLTDDPRFLQATEAVILTRVDDYPMQQLLRAVVDKHALLAHQQRVVSGEQEPSY